MAGPDGKACIPLRHLSVRVPWHDAGWDGTVRRSPRLNSSCLALNRIGSAKNDAAKERYAGQLLSDAPDEDVPPCFSERVNFLSPKPQRRLAHHAYAKTSNHHKHIADTAFTHPAYSAAATPFGWLLKDRARGKEWRKGRSIVRPSPSATGSTQARNMNRRNPIGLIRDRGYKDTPIKRHCWMASSGR
jgi:hypothetical protein